MKKKTILCLFDYLSTTGFGTVSKNIVPRIKKEFGEKITLHICAINYFGEPIYEEDGTIIFSAIKSATKKDEFGRFGFLKILQDSNEYDGIFIIQDLGVIVPIIPHLKFIKEEKRKANKKTFKSIFYFPVDCNLLPQLVKDLEFFDNIITYTEFGRDRVLNFRPELRGDLKVILHGTNLKEFYPIPKNEISDFRKDYFKDEGDKFIITNVNRNQPRKDIPTTIFGFIEAKKNWNIQGKKPFLYLHMHPHDPKGWDLRAILNQTDLIEGEDYRFPDKEMENAGAPTEMLNKIYNSCDLYVTTSLGEGFGLVTVECMAAKLPIICPNNTSFTELCDNGNRAHLIDYLMPYASMADNIIREACTPSSVAEAIIHMAENICGLNEEMGGTEQVNEMVESAFDYSQKLSWDNQSIIGRWIEYFKSTYGL